MTVPVLLVKIIDLPLRVSCIDYHLKPNYWHGQLVCRCV